MGLKYFFYSSRVLPNFNSTFCNESVEFDDYKNLRW